MSTQLTKYATGRTDHWTDRFRPRRPISLRLANCTGDIIVQRVSLCAQTQVHSLFLSLSYWWDDHSTRPVRDKAQDRRLN
ncbi:unnamed protein product, partial [Brenthis ino]